MRTTDEAIAALAALPCGRRLLEAVVAVDGVWLVGGAVRDLLRGGRPSEFDLVVEGDVAAVGALLGEPLRSHDRFGTLTVAAGGCSFDVASARRETYAHPGALPDVAPATVDEDLERRDFTINAIAMAMSGVLVAVPGALDDLAAGRLRVLHRRSFLDDPTRLWRLARYAARLRFAIEPGTEQLALAAVKAGALETVSGDRLGAELRLALLEPDPLAALDRAQQLGLAAGLALDRAVVEEALTLLPAGARADVTVLGAVSTAEHAGWLDRLGFTGGERHALARCAALPPLAQGAPSSVTAALRDEPVEAVAVAGARGDPATARAFLHDWRHVRLVITGDDLLAAGIAQGPELGARLAHVLAQRLDGAIEPGRDGELRAALDFKL